MTDISAERSLRFLVLSSLIFLQFISGYSDDSLSSKNGTKTESHSPSHSGGNTVSIVAIICLVLVAAVLLSYFLFKFWQKKKREEQYARLLKLFEEDDQLELELGLRD
ncbi:uncharacterized protein LOC111409819 [Olea europaea subsp. europaea]|uniref:Uncharacterized protein LOC111409819 n=1 Tax=Olea europaea subsp. europaea TaxID=158383 RepID=A0A8S0RXY2_OLEEU|nr:uncharacterized protein LOC111409819 [Olea europaea subsp. europaea]